MCMALPLLVNVYTTLFIEAYCKGAKNKISLYLKEQNELWESLDRFHHQAIQSHSVTAGLLTML